MVDWKDLLKPNKKKLILFLLFLVVFYGVFTTLFLGHEFFFFALGKSSALMTFYFIPIFVTYLVACSLDYFLDKGDLKNWISPNKTKLILFITLLVPFYAVFLFFALGLPNSINSFNYVLFYILPLVISYLVASSLDFFIESKSVKYGLGGLFALGSAFLGYLFYKSFSQPIVYDPVHPTNCRETCEGIIHNATNKSDKIMEKYNQCVQNCTANQ